MTIAQAQEIVREAGLNWRVVSVEDKDVFHVLITCKWIIRGYEQTRFVTYSKMFDGICKIQ